MATQTQVDASNFSMAPEKIRRPNSHPFPSNPGKSQSLPATRGGSDRDSHNSQNGDIVHGELKRKRGRKSDVQVDGVKQPEDLHYGYESYLAYDTCPPGFEGLKEGDSFLSRPSRDFFNLSANSHVDPVWESDTKYNNLFSNQSQTGLCGSEGLNYTQAQSGWSNSNEFLQVPLHPPIDLTSGATFLPFQFQKWDSKDQGLKNGDNFELSEKEMIEEIEYMFAQNEWDLPNVSPAPPEASNSGTSIEHQRSQDDERSLFRDLWDKMGGQERTQRFYEPSSGHTAEKDASSGETQPQQPKVLRAEDLGDCSSLSSEEKLLLESLISKINSRKQVNGLKGKGKETQRVTETPGKEGDNSAIQKKSSIPVGHSTVNPDQTKVGPSRIQENCSKTGINGRVWNQAVQKANSSNLSEPDFPMLGDNTVDSARKRSKESGLEENCQSIPESICKRDHCGKTKEDIAFSPSPSKNAKMSEEKTLKKQKVVQSETEMPSQVQKETIEHHKVQESDVEMDNVDEVEIGGEKNVHALNETKNVGTAAKRTHNETEKHEGNVDQHHLHGSSPPQIKKKKKRKKKQGQSSKKNEEDEEKSNPGTTPGSYRLSEPLIPPGQQEEVTSERKGKDKKEKGCCVGDKGRESVEDSKGFTEGNIQKSQLEMNQHAEQKRPASVWTEVSKRKVDPGLLTKLKIGDRTDLSKDKSDESCIGTSHQCEPQGNVSGGTKVDIDKTERGRRNEMRSFKHEESPQGVHQGHIGSDGTSVRRRDVERESHTTLKNLKVDKDTTVPQPQPCSSKSRDHLSSVPSEKSHKSSSSSNSVPTNKMQGSQAAGKTEAKQKVNEAGHVLKDDIKSARETSKSLPSASASSSGDGKCQTEKESKPSRSGVNAKKGSHERDESADRETNEGKQERERDDKSETKSAPGAPHSTKEDKHQSSDGGFYKPLGRTRRDSERKDKSKEGKTFDEIRGKKQDKNANEKQQRDRSDSVRDRKPGRDTTARSKHSSTSRSDHIFVSNHQHFARWKKKMSLRNLSAAISAIFVYLKCVAVDIWSELPQFAVVLLLCLWAQGLSTFHYYKDLFIDAVVDIFNIVATLLPVVLSKFSKVKFLWSYVLKPIVILAIFLVVLTFDITLRLIGIIIRLLRIIYQLKYPPSDKDEFARHGADQNREDTKRDRQEFHGHSFSHDDYREGQSHTSNGSWESNSGHSANFSGYGEEFGGTSFNNFSSHRRHEGMNGTPGARAFGSESNTSTSSSRSQSSQSSNTRPVNKGAGTVIRRILLAEEEDPYDILGLASDCLQEDIKKAYRRLAVIVHPDKCDHPDAQRAFQKLQVAHDKIGSEEDRTKFEQEKRNSELARTFMDEFQKQCDLINNSMRCQCGHLHPKIATDRDPAFARYCWQHSTFHSAQQNDIWAETSCMGLKIHCFYCDGGIVFDVTRWAQCERILGRMEKNACKVTFRVQSTPEPQNKPPPNFEDFFRQFEPGAHQGRTGSRQKDKNSREKNNKKKKRNGRR